MVAAKALMDSLLKDILKNLASRQHICGIMKAPSLVTGQTEAIKNKSHFLKEELKKVRGITEGPGEICDNANQTNSPHQRQQQVLLEPK